MVLAMIGTTAVPSMAGSVSAYGSARAIDGGATSGAYVSYEGALTEGGAGTGSYAYGETASSYSSVYGEVFQWDYAHVDAYTEANAESVSDDAYVYVDAGTWGNAYYTTLETYAGIGTSAVGEEVYADANAGTIATWELDETGTPGIVSYGETTGNAYGSYVYTGVYTGENYASALSEGNAYSNGFVSAEGYYSEVGQSIYAWSNEDGQHADILNWGYALGSYVQASVTAIAEYID